MSNPAACRSNASRAMYPRTTQPRTQQRAAHETNWRKTSPSPQRSNVRASASMSAPRSEMTAAEEERQLTEFIIKHVTSTYQRRPVPSRERYLQEKQALGDGKKKPWAGLRLSDVGIFLSQHCQDLRKSVTKRKKLKDLLANRDELFLVNTGKGKKNNPYVYLKGTIDRKSVV